MTRQLAFDLPAAPMLRREDFFVSPANALALATVEGWRTWPGARMLLVGPAGTGKTHLAQIWAGLAAAHLTEATSLRPGEVDALAALPALAIEDAQAVAGNAVAEGTLFHLMNLGAARGQTLLITASRPPRDWGVKLPDLASRLQAAPLTRLPLPDDALLSAVLVKLFADRQVTVPAPLIPYLVSRMDRSIEAARGLVAALDAQALAQGRAVSRAMAADLLDNPRHPPP